MTETQLSSESRDVSLWMLPSLDDESEFASPREDLLSRNAPSCGIWRCVTHATFDK